ncbi:class III lanthipeptide [Baia soyae]|uniref:Uncharacterized protein n=1 Tax=Baia soyae TaxID=1544746 RepID=A0A4R2SFX4_9BACL|nr:class III lanthipeptide [Baia soyae]TCP70271.1 hypothetical protein EDD57_10387 [Baia soyae]TCP70272.1 hypothetical protein EDD57_10388 [Baia soyae]
MNQVLDLQKISQSNSEQPEMGTWTVVVRTTVTTVSGMSTISNNC